MVFQFGKKGGDLKEVGDNKVQLVSVISETNILWDTDIDFDAGSYSNTERDGSGAAAKVTLQHNGSNNDNGGTKLLYCCVRKKSDVRYLANIRLFLYTLFYFLDILLI